MEIVLESVKEWFFTLAGCSLSPDPTINKKLLGILDQRGSLTPVGKWLCEPQGTLWFYNQKPWNQCPLAGLARLGAGHQAVLAEQLGWLLGLPEQLSQNKNPIVIAPVEDFELSVCGYKDSVTVENRYLKMLFKQGITPLLETLQLMGVLTHSSLHEFWVSKDIRSSSNGDLRTIYF